MNTHYRDQSNIAANQRARLGDGTAHVCDLVETGLPTLAHTEWREIGLEEQSVVNDGGFDTISTYPHDERQLPNN